MPLHVPGLLALPLEGAYRLVVSLRVLAYRLGLLRVRRVAQPVIAIGNLTAGGSGTTPFAEYLARLAAEAGLRPACLSRGHGRTGRSRLARVCVAEGIPADPLAIGDENAMLALRNPSLPVYAGADRFQLARMAALADRPDVLVLDDAFQHLRLHRNLNVLLVDAAAGVGNGHLLPAGPLREPLPAAARADVIVITKANWGDAAGLRQALSHYTRGPIFTAEYRPARLARLDGQRTLPPQAVAGRDVSLICGIAQPDTFRRAAHALGARVQALLSFPDHHPYPDADLSRLHQALAGADAGAPGWLTTEKDAVKLRGRLSNPERLWVLEMEVLPEPAAHDFFFDYLRKLKLE